MSGGHWEYLQYRFFDVAEDVKKLIEKNGKEKTKEELKEESWRDNDWYEKYPEDKFHYKYPDEVIEEFKKGADAILKAQVYMQRIAFHVPSYHDLLRLQYLQLRKCRA